MIRIEKDKQSSNVKTIKIVLAIMTFIICLVFGKSISSNFNPTTSLFKTRFSSDKQVIAHPLSYGQNATHLWSLRFADENYFRLIRLLPCRVVEYKGGPKPDKIDSCDHSSTNEFSIENTFKAQKWLYEYQHPVNCANQRFAIIRKFAWSGFGSTIHQIVWAFAMAMADNRIAVYETPGDWLYGDCNSNNPDCLFLPITNCPVPSTAEGNRVIHINADMGHWHKPIHPPIFQNRTFNWYRAQLLFYLMRFKPETLAYVQKTTAQYLKATSIDLHHPYIAVYVRRSDKITGREMSQAYPLQQYFDLFNADARRANITNVYINSEDERVFDEFTQLNQAKKGYYKLLSIKGRKNVIYASLIDMPKRERGQIILEFLTDLFIEANADLHVGTLTSNWCRLVDELRLTLGKTFPYYTPENRFLLDRRRRK